MAEHVWSVLCRKGVLDSNNNLSLFDVVESLKVEGQLREGGGLKFPMELVTLWVRSDLNTPEIIETRVQVKTPKGRLIGSTPGKVRLDTAPRGRLTMNIDGMPFHGAGVYRFIVQNKQHGKWKNRATVPVELLVESKLGPAGDETNSQGRSKPRKK